MQRFTKMTIDKINIMLFYTFSDYKPFSPSKKRYKVHIDIKPWGLAQAVCVAEGGRLAIIRNREEGNFVLDLMNLPKNQLNYGNLRKNAFVGYHDYYIDGRFLTVTGNSLII